MLWWGGGVGVEGGMEHRGEFAMFGILAAARVIF